MHEHRGDGNADGASTAAIVLAVFVFSCITVLAWLLCTSDRPSRRRAYMGMPYETRRACRDGDIEIRQYAGGQTASVTVPGVNGDAAAMQSEAVRVLRQFLDARGTPASPTLTRITKGQCTVYVLVPMGGAALLPDDGVTVEAALPLTVAVLPYCGQGMQYELQLRERMQRAMRVNQYDVLDWSVTATYDSGYSEYWVLITPMGGPPYQPATMSTTPVRLVGVAKGVSPEHAV